MISIAYILKDEAKNIINSLESLAKIKEEKEIIVIDTGSTDNTVEICRHYTGNIFYFIEEKFSHANARNKAISKCTGEWIFMLDGDEEVSEWETPNENFDFANVTVKNKIGERYTYFPAPRLFKNNKGVKYSGMKQAIPDMSFIENGLKGYVSGIEILHFGYDLTEAEREIKNRTNLQTHIEMLTTEPNNLINKYFLAQTYFGLKEYQSAIDFGTLAMNDPINKELKAALCITIFLSLNYQNKISIAKFWLMKSLEYLEMQVLGRNLAIQVFMNDKEYDKAAEQFELMEYINNNKLSQLPNDCYYTETELLNFNKEIKQCHTILAQ